MLGVDLQLPQGDNEFHQQRGQQHQQFHRRSGSGSLGNYNLFEEHQNHLNNTSSNLNFSKNDHNGNAQIEPKLSSLDTSTRYRRASTSAIISKCRQEALECGQNRPPSVFQASGRYSLNCSRSVCNGKTLLVSKDIQSTSESTRSTPNLNTVTDVVRNYGNDPVAANTLPNIAVDGCADDSEIKVAQIHILKPDCFTESDTDSIAPTISMTSDHATIVSDSLRFPNVSREQGRVQESTIYFDPPLAAKCHKDFPTEPPKISIAAKTETFENNSENNQIDSASGLFLSQVNSSSEEYLGPSGTCNIATSSTYPAMSGIRSSNLLCVVEAEDDLSDWESPIDVDLADPPVRKNRQSSWRKIRSFILWSPFIQVFKKHRYPWIQLAGHQGNFHAGEAGSVLKKLDSREQACFKKIMSDKLKDYVPEYRGDVDKNGDTYIQLQDLLCSFSQPNVMDVKMGVRTYLEDELQKARRSPTLRKDMYQKMIEVDSTAPTTDEHEQKAVTKPRYMQWRDEMSSSVELGFRVEGIKKSDGNSSKDFKKTKTKENIVDIVKSFVGDNENIVAKYIRRLKDVMQTQETSEFFRSHEVIGSSLLFVHDTQENVGVWMIDFGKTEPLPSSVSIDHRTPWNEGNHEDGYLFGLDNLISIFEEVQNTLTSTAV